MHVRDVPIANRVCSLPPTGAAHPFSKRREREQASQKFRRTPECTMRCPKWNLGVGERQASDVFQAAGSARVGHLARVQATHEPKHNRVENLARLANCNPRETTREGADSRAHSQHNRGCTEFCATCKGAKRRAGEEPPRMQSRQGPRQA